MTQAIAGADGCRAGWIVVRETLPATTIFWVVVPSLQALFERPDAPGLVAMRPRPTSLLEFGH